MSYYAVLLISVAFTFSGCNRPNSTTENSSPNTPVETDQVEAPTEVQPNSIDVPETSNEEVDESLMDAEYPQDDFIDETSEPASSPSAEHSTEKKNEPLKKFVNFEEALQAAKTNARPIVLYFTGSDWCPPCMRMQQEIFSTEAFALFSNQNLNFVYLEFPRRKKISPEQEQHNFSLAKKYNIEGYPTIILLSNQGAELARIEQYLSGGPQKLINWIQQNQAR